MIESTAAIVVLLLELMVGIVILSLGVLIVMTVLDRIRKP